MHHSRTTALLHYGRKATHFPNVIPTEQDAMALFSIQFHHFFSLSPEAWPFFYQLCMGNQLPLVHQPASINHAKALLYGKKLADSEIEIVLLQHLQQYLQVELAGDSSEAGQAGQSRQFHLLGPPSQLSQLS